jgi:hypothetical protein
MKKAILCLIAGMMMFAVSGIAAPPAAQQGGGGKTGGFQKKQNATFELMRLVRNVGRLDSGDKGHLTPDQAKKILVILTPLRKQIALNNVQAKAATNKINAVLTKEQKKIIKAMKPEKGMGGMGSGHHPEGEGGMMGGGGPHPPDGGGMMGGGGGPHHPDGEGMMGGGGPHQGPHPGGPGMENFNPFNPPKDSPMAKNTDKLFKQLEKTAKKSK